MNSDNNKSLVPKFWGRLTIQNGVTKFTLAINLPQPSFSQAWDQL